MAAVGRMKKGKADQAEGTDSPVERHRGTGERGVR